MKVHFDIDGTIDECQAFMAMIGFPISTSMTAKEQDAVTADENGVADRLDESKRKLETLGQP